MHFLGSNIFIWHLVLLPDALDRGVMIHKHVLYFLVNFCLCVVDFYYYYYHILVIIIVIIILYFLIYLLVVLIDVRNCFWTWFHVFIYLLFSFHIPWYVMYYVMLCSSVLEENNKSIYSYLSLRAQLSVCVSACLLKVTYSRQTYLPKSIVTLTDIWVTRLTGFDLEHTSLTF